MHLKCNLRDLPWLAEMPDCWPMRSRPVVRTNDPPAFVCTALHSAAAGHAGPHWWLPGEETIGKKWTPHELFLVWAAEICASFRIKYKSFLSVNVCVCVRACVCAPKGFAIGSHGKKWCRCDTKFCQSFIHSRF